MSINVTEYINVAEKLEKLGLHSSIGIALLPDNLNVANNITDLRQYVEANTVRTLLRTNGIQLTEIFDSENQPPYIQNNGFKWFGPTLFISYAFLSQDPNSLAIALGLITNYLSDTFKGRADCSVSFNIVVERKDGSCTQANYDGSVEGIKEFKEVVSELHK